MNKENAYGLQDQQNEYGKDDKFELVSEAVTHSRQQSNQPNDQAAQQAARSSQQKPSDSYSEDANDEEYR